MKNVIVKIPEALCSQIRTDLSRTHEFAYERVGFVFGNSKILPYNKELIIINGYLPVEDNHYIEDSSVGARINGEAIRAAMQLAMNRKCSVFHIHEHLGEGTPYFSSTDLLELPGIAQSLKNAHSQSIHGLILLSEDGINAKVYSKEPLEEVVLEKAVRVGYPMNFHRGWYENDTLEINRYERQSFLGESSQYKIDKVKVGIIGLGGGGSHIIQQLAHLGIQNYVLFDDDQIEESNLNRLVGGTLEDTYKKLSKTEIAKRVILGLQPKAEVTIKERWEDNTSYLQACDVVFGAVDSFMSRRDIELECRRYLMPYIDIGIDVRIVGSEPPRLYGQIILSMPGGPCMHCLGFLNERILSKEAARYGDAGSKPQVVWANGVVASNAVGIFVDLITGWSGNRDMDYYQEYDGNKIAVSKSYRLDFLKNEGCSHFQLVNAGPVNWPER